MSQPPQVSSAHIGFYPSFGAYLSFYETAVRRLFELLESGKETPDSLALPMLALMRHSMELGYKFSLWELHQALGEKFDTQAYGHHDLAKLHAALCDCFKRTVAHYGLPDHVEQSFDEYRPKTEAAMQRFAALDKLSFSFRYPFDKKTGGANFVHQMTVDLAEIRDLYEQAMVLLRHTADVVGEYVEIHRDMEAEMHQWAGGW
ncbi:MAG: hypothetical protein IPK15_18495 [Verrucomicrobia bacterium]|nr:hypothetical protein [Verrucomicrobiota bacterium]